MNLYLAEIRFPNGTKTFRVVYADSDVEAHDKVSEHYIGCHGIIITQPIQ